MPSNEVSHLLPNQEPAQAGDGMPASAAPPAPPPFQRTTAQHNPYDFITNSPPQKKKSLLPGGGSKTTRLILAVLGGAVLIGLILIVVSLFGRGSTALKSDYTSLAQQQTELIRVSGIGVSKARQADAKNLAITAQLSLTSQQASTLALAKKAGAATDNKSLAAGRNTKTDDLLTRADQANQFDEVFTATLRDALQKYQQTLKKLYDASTASATKTTLSKNYNAVNALLGTTEPAAL